MLNKEKKIRNELNIQRETKSQNQYEFSMWKVTHSFDVPGMNAFGSSHIQLKKKIFNCLSLWGSISFNSGFWMKMWQVELKRVVLVSFHNEKKNVWKLLQSCNEGKWVDVFANKQPINFRVGRTRRLRLLDSGLKYQKKNKQKKKKNKRNRVLCVFYFCPLHQSGRREEGSAVSLWEMDWSRRHILARSSASR